MMNSAYLLKASGNEEGRVPGTEFPFGREMSCSHTSLCSAICTAFNPQYKLE